MRLIRQKKTHDCGVACLAMVAGVSYRRALRAVKSFDEDSENGLTNGDIIAAALELGIVLVTDKNPKREYRLAIARVRWGSGAQKKHSPGGHFVCLAGPIVLCPVEGRMKLSQYLEKDDGHLCAVLVAQP